MTTENKPQNSPMTRTVITTPRRGPLEPLLCHFDVRITVEEAAGAAALVLGYYPSRFTLATMDHDVLDRTANVETGVYELVEIGGTV